MLKQIPSVIIFGDSFIFKCCSNAAWAFSDPESSVGGLFATRRAFCSVCHVIRHRPGRSCFAGMSAFARSGRTNQSTRGKRGKTWPDTVHASPFKCIQLGNFQGSRIRMTVNSFVNHQFCFLNIAVGYILAIGICARLSGHCST